MTTPAPVRDTAGTEAAGKRKKVVVVLVAGRLFSLVVP